MIIWLITIIFLLFFSYFSYMNIVYGLSVIIILLPSYLLRLSFFGLPTTLLELMFVLLFIIWLLKDKKYTRINFIFKNKSENRIPKILRCLLLLWIMASLLGLYINPTYSALGLWRAYYLEPMMFFLIFIYSVNSIKDIKYIINSLFVLILYLFIVGVFQYFTDWNLLSAYNYPNPKRLTSVFSYPNALSLLIAPISSFFIGLWLSSKDKIKNILYFIIFITNFILIILSKSHGAILAILLTLLFYLFFTKKIQKVLKLFIFLIFSIILFLLPLNNYYTNIKQQLFNPILDLNATSLEIRSSQWQETFLMLKDNFITGAGVDGYQSIMNQYHKIDWLEVYLYPHNIFLNFWSEIGLFGLLIFLSLFVYIIYLLKILFKKKHKLSLALSMSWSVWFIHGLVDVPYFKNDLSVLFFILFALTTVSFNLFNNED